MSITLFEHNKTAYDAVVSMLLQRGKAAVIHPTGTGKSFIGFKLCADNPKSTVCWLSPSDYIFKTQIENLESSGSEVPRNILFFTYAKLMMLTPDEISEIQPDYIILDEFHRCGAEQWGKGVRCLLDAYPSVPILGLSATNIRYLDNQRDMADELFDGNIASEMTLGEAIVRGILNPPKYIISVYSYQKDLSKYKERIKRLKNGAARDAAEEYFEALRRALEKSEGLDKIFSKHIDDKHGKYIVFCANFEHMNEMAEHVHEWFSAIDPEPNVYKAYSEDPTTSRSFADFKADNSEHLKLLFCIDMLNEGIHVDDISGVILFRPTISPIIYKQQIGRALSAGKRKNPVIFDIVNNFENLYSIAGISQEMQAAITYYRFLGEEKEVVTDGFEIIDEVRDCRALFDSMNDALTASWDIMFSHAEEYYKENGNLEVPVLYRTTEGYSLGKWIQTQRRVRSGDMFGKLDDIQIEKLDSIGMRWGSYRDASWDRNFAATKKYRDEYGDLNISAEYVTETGLALGKWISQLRTCKKNGIQINYLTDERINKLNDLGMLWSIPDYIWEQNFAEAMNYYRVHGNLDVPDNFVCESGIKLGVWMRKLRSIKNGQYKWARLSDDQIRRLDSIEMVWDNKFTRLWNKGFSEANEYYRKFGNLNVPFTYKTPSGYKLGNWIAGKRESYKSLSEERKNQLDAIGMIWGKPDPWEMRFSIAKGYYEKNGNLNVPAKYKVDGINLNKWLSEQRQIYHGNRPGKSLTTEQIKRLEAISFDWDTESNRLWAQKYNYAFEFYRQHGDLSLTKEHDKSLERWLNQQKKYYQQGKLNEAQINKLNEIGLM